MATPNPNDGTVLGTAEVISDEYIDPVTGGRRDPMIPGSGYKAPRSKIIVGPYGQDWGDASHDQPLPVEARESRRYHEDEGLRQREDTMFTLRKSQTETVSLADARGYHLTTRGVR